MYLRSEPCRQCCTGRQGLTGRIGQSEVWMSDGATGSCVVVVRLWDLLVDGPTSPLICCRRIPYGQGSKQRKEVERGGKKHSLRLILCVAVLRILISMWYEASVGE